MNPQIRRHQLAAPILLIAVGMVTCGPDAALREEAAGALVVRSIDEVVSLPDEPSAPFDPIRGAFEVTARGAASYRIPLAVSPGRLGLAPALALEYSSDGAYGLLGMGFQLTGLRSISRCPRSVALDGYAAPIAFDDTDAFCLDGRRLVPVTEAEGSVSFRLERDDRSRTIRVTREGLDGFEVWLEDGRILELGLSGASRLARASGGVLTWALSRMRDRHGNAVEYFYEQRTMPVPGNPEVLETSEFHPTSIRYTSNDGSTGAPVLPARREIRFEYERFPDSAKHFGYRAGMRSNITNGVDRISMWVEETKVWEYRLDYETSPSTGRARLEFVRQCDAKDVCRPPIQLKWDDGEFGFAAAVGTVQSALVLPQEPALLMPTPMDLADLDGDGRSDLVVVRPDGLHWARSIARPGVPEVDPFPTEALAAAGVPARWWSADLNRDGQSELLIETARGLRIAEKSGEGTFAEERFDDLWTEDLDLFEVPLSRGYFFSDLDGDGLQEILGHEDSEPETLRFIRRGLATPTGAFQSPAFARIASTPFDLDGDGASELIGEDSPGVVRAVDVVRTHLQRVGDVPVATTASGGDPYRAYLTTGTRIRSLPAPVSAAAAGQTLIGDFNGDGFQDYLAVDEGTPATLTAYFSTGVGFEARTYIAPQEMHWRPETSARNRSSPAPGRALVGDFNRDGRDDLLVDGVDGKKHVLEFRPEGLQLRSDRTPIPSRGDVYAVGDINGDGLLDVVAQTVQPHALSIHYQRGRRPDRVVTIREGSQTSAYQISFDTLGSSSVYTRDIDCQSTLPSVCVSGGDAEVVRQVVFDGGTGTLGNGISPAQPVTRTYAYRNARVSQSGRGWLGFEWRVETEIARGRTRTTRYDNFTRPPDYPLLGLVIEDELITELPGTAGEPGQISVVRHEVSFAVKEAAPGVRVAYPRMEKHEEFFSPSRAAFQHSPPRPTRTLTREVLEVDGWGLPTRISSDLGEGHRYEEQRQYLHDPVRSIVARPTAVGVLSVVPAEFGVDEPNQERVYAFEYVPDTGERFARSEGLSVAVTQAEHQAFTNAWRARIPYGPSGTGAATRDSVLDAARDIYGNYPEILRGLGL